MIYSLRVLHLGIASILIATPCLAVKSDILVTPGVGIGIAKLGMKQMEMKKAAGNFDASYSLPSGIKVERADWKEDGLTTIVLKVFYGADGKAIQIGSAASTPVTADGISKKSTIGELVSKHPKLKLTEYQAKSGRVDYYDDVHKGITYEFRRLDDDLARRMYAIIVHKPGVPVISDADEVQLK
jgi:hypothetical protein